MDESLRNLIAQMNGKSKEFSEAELTEIFRQARQEAIAEAKSILRDQMVHTILEKMLDECAAAIPEAPEPTTTTRQPVEQPVIQDETAQTLSEIEQLRQQIAENEQQLRQIKTPVSQPVEPVPAVIEATGTGYYVFGVIGHDQFVPDILEGIDNLGYPVYGLPYQELQAVVCQVPLSEFGETPIEDNLNNPTWLEARVRGHQVVLQALSEHSPAIPMKFCTIYLSEERVLEVLAEHFNDFVETLRRLDGKHEWGVKLYYDHEMLAKQIAATNPRVQEIQVEIAKKSDGVAYFARKKLEMVVSEEIERSCDQVAQACHDSLSGSAEEGRITRLHSKEVTGKPDEMVLNGAYLVIDQNIDQFLAELESLKTRYSSDGFSFEHSGPWPAYNFVASETEEAQTDE